MSYSNVQSYYGAFLNLQDRLCVVVGGGKVARRKIENLVASGSRIRIVSPELDDVIQTFVDGDRVEYIAREYQNGDLIGASIVFAATNVRHINHRVYEEATRVGILVNVVDDPESCSLIVPAVYRQDELQIAISTSGTNPAEAKMLRMLLQSDVENGTHDFIDKIRERCGRG